MEKNVYLNMCNIAQEMMGTETMQVRN